MNLSGQNPDLYHQVGEILTAITSEMKRIGYWSDHLIPQTPQNVRSANGLGSLPYVQWLQYIFIPTLDDIIQEMEPFPGSSLVGAMAVREFGGNPEAKTLVDLLCALDALFQPN